MIQACTAHPRPADALVASHEPSSNPRYALSHRRASNCTAGERQTRTQSSPQLARAALQPRELRELRGAVSAEHSESEAKSVSRRFCGGRNGGSIYAYEEKEVDA